MGQVFMNGCEEEREHTRRVSLMRVGEAAAASRSSERRRRRWLGPLKNKQRNKDNKYTNKQKLFTDQHTQTHTEMLILWL